MTLVDLYEGGRIRPLALQFLYDLMREREPEINISHREFPTFEQHRAFWTRRHYRLAYLIEIEEGPAWAGYVSATQNNEIGIVLKKEWRGKGYGTQAVRELMRLHKPLPAEPSVRNGHWLANIAPGNAASQTMFSRLGFKPIQVTFELGETP